MASQLSVVVSVTLVVVVCALLIVRRPSATGILASETASATRGATEGVRRYERRHNVVAAALTGLLGACLLVVFGIAYQLDSRSLVAPREAGLFVVGGLLVGGTMVAIGARLSRWSASRGASSVADGTRRSFDEALRRALGSGFASSALGGSMACLVYGLFVFGVHRYVQPQTDRDLIHVVWLTAGLPLGAGFVALVGQVGAGMLTVGAHIAAGVLERSIETAQDESASDAAGTDGLTPLVGDLVEVNRRGALAIAVVTAELFGLMLLAALAYRESDDWPSATALVFFPLVVRAFGLLAALFGVLVVRSDDTETPTAPLARGILVAGMLCIVAAFGASKWLLGDAWLRVGGSVVCGSVALWLCAWVTLLYSDRRYRAVRTVAEAARGGGPSVILRGLAVGLEGGCAVLLVAAFAATSGTWLGSGLEVEQGATIGAMATLLGFTACSPLLFAMDGMESIVNVSGSVIRAGITDPRPDVTARARLLHAVGSSVHALVSTFSTLGVAGVTFLVCRASLGWSTNVPVAREGTAFAAPVMAALIVGVVVVFAFAGMLLKRVLQASRLIVSEGLRQGEQDGAPGDVVEAMSRASLRGMSLPVGVALAVPICFFVALRITATGDRVDTSAEAVVALIGAATTVGALAALLFTFAGGAWNNAKRFIESGVRGRSDYRATYEGIVVGDTVGEAVKRIINPSFQAAIITVALLGMVVLPFFF